MQLKLVLSCFIILCIHRIISEPITLGLGVAGISAAIGYGYNSYLKCKLQECCNDDYIVADVAALHKMLSEKLYGQKIAHETVVHAIKGHIQHVPKKPLVMSFHGVPGSGKNYVTSMIIKTFFKSQMQSKYFHFYNGRDHFPLDSEVDNYKTQLANSIFESLKECPRSVFVFDEVDKIPPGLLDALVPYLDYGTMFERDGTRVTKNEAIYILLSNTGSNQIVDRLIDLWERGKSRVEAKLQDFEHLISIGAFNEKGGFQHSDTIATSVIDHYVPFLPLESEQVRLCVIDAFAERNSQPTEEMILEAMSHVTFGPEPHNLYSLSGCKRLHSKVATIINKEYGKI